MKWESCVRALSINLSELLNTTRILPGVSFPGNLSGIRSAGGGLMIGVVVLPLLGLAPTLTLVTSRRGSAAVMQETLEAVPLAPGVAEDSVFITDASVKIWKEFQRDGPADAAENLRELRRSPRG